MEQSPINEKHHTKHKNIFASKPNTLVELKTELE
uniref:Uncharacterized protein n=1 Tax=Physcomitrium patens TaxID=3218 RepID=A0A2K1JGD7_PHYPA|nr:hypothetical protein PHYPA_018017 [Physcomitrium patens]